MYFEIFNINEEEEYDDLAGIFDDEELPEEYYDVQVSDIEVRVGLVSHDGGSQCTAPCYLVAHSV